MIKCGGYCYELPFQDKSTYSNLEIWELLATMSVKKWLLIKPGAMKKKFSS